MKTIDMQYMRYLNLFEKITKVRTRYCFPYNNQLVFAVKPKFVSKAIGEGGKNVKKVSRIVKKRVKVIPQPKDESRDEIKKFISKVIEPKKFRDLKIDKDKGKIILNTDRRNKAALIGRGKKRRKELSKITENFFDMKVEIR